MLFFLVWGIVFFLVFYVVEFRGFVGIRVLDREDKGRGDGILGCLVVLGNIYFLFLVLGC